MLECLVRHADYALNILLRLNTLELFKLYWPALPRLTYRLNFNNLKNISVGIFSDLDALMIHGLNTSTAEE